MKLPGHCRENVFLGRPNETRRRLLKRNNSKDGERKEKWEGGQKILKRNDLSDREKGKRKGT
jgi:hypothetical protein